MLSFLSGILPHESVALRLRTQELNKYLTVFTKTHLFLQEIMFFAFIQSCFILRNTISKRNDLFVKMSSLTI